LDGREQYLLQVWPTAPARWTASTVKALATSGLITIGEEDLVYKPGV
jgi:hypothetical protein